MERTYTSLKKLVDSDFTVLEVYGYKFKKYDPDTRKMLVSETHEKGYRKVYELNTDKGHMDLPANQLGSLYEGVQVKGTSSIVGRTFAVKSNGKDGMDIRYFINPTKKSEVRVDVAPLEISEDPIDLSEIPF